MTDEKPPGNSPSPAPTPRQEQGGIESGHAPEPRVTGDPPPLEEKFLGLPPHQQKAVVASREYAKRTKQVREVMTRLSADAAWDRMQARDVPPEIIDFVAPRLAKGVPPQTIARDLGLREKGGVASREWKKIQAFFRQGFRASAEAYLYQQSSDYYKILTKTKEILEDAFENGVPIIEQTTFKDKDGCKQVETEVHLVKGATKELAAFIETYSRAVQTLPKLWKDFGAIGEAPGKAGAPGQGGLTIVVKTNVPTPSQADIDAYRQKMVDMRKPVIDVTPVKKSVDQS